MEGGLGILLEYNVSGPPLLLLEEGEGVLLLLQRNQKELVEKLLRMHILLSPLDSMKEKGMGICVICISSLSVQ